MSVLTRFFSYPPWKLEYSLISRNKDVTAIATLQYEWVSLREFRKERNTYHGAVAGLIPGLGQSSAKGTGNPLQYSCLGYPMDRGAWWATVRRDAQSRTQLSNSLQAIYYSEPWGNSGRENTGHWPQLAEVQIREMVLLSFSHLPTHFVLVLVELLSCVVPLCDPMDSRLLLKTLNSLTWDTWLSLTVISWYSDYLPFAVKLLYNLALPPCLLRAVLSGLLEMLPPELKSLKFPLKKM